MSLNPTSIEYCTHTWNPVTGCLHGCSFCYARRIANRFGKTDKTKNFEPEFHSDRLHDPTKRKKPAVIFVSDMGDLFGEWVPRDWIEKIFDVCRESPQHVYLFLTKNEIRYDDFILNNEHQPNWFFGYTTNGDIGIQSKSISGRYSTIDELKTWVSIEPMLGGPFLIDNLTPPSFIAVGAQTPYSKKHKPKFSWIRSIREQCDDLKIPLFEKDNLTPHLDGMLRVMEYPKEILEIMKERY